MKRVILNLLISLLVLIGCKKYNNDSITAAKEIIKQEKTILETAIYEEVNLTKKGNYENRINSLELSYKTLHIKLKYIEDKAYIKAENQSEILFDWNPVNINFYYNLSFEKSEKDVHLLINKKDLSKWYILFPSFTEEYPTYSLYNYVFGKSISYLGEYSSDSFDIGKFYYDENSKELFSNSIDKTIKLKYINSLEFKIPDENIKQDIQKIKNYTSVNTNLIASKSTKDYKSNENWKGSYIFKLSDLERMGESHTISYRFLIDEKPFVEVTINESDINKFSCEILKITRDTLIIRKTKSNDDFILSKIENKYFIAGDEIYMLNPPNDRYALEKQK
ncbi:hypothetical protein GCM10009430_48830 [Aquimarina litoralis]|uniref:Lipoprotein n=1 Tax=Aquimarina litoralis TaxID=584605 RepID=A0ABN1JAS7_9FLAO